MLYKIVSYFYIFRRHVVTNETDLVLSIQLTPDESGAEGKEMKDPEKLGSSESTVESAPVSGTTSSSTSFEVEERIKEGARPADDVSPGESTVNLKIYIYICNNTFLYYSDNT